MTTTATKPSYTLSVNGRVDPKAPVARSVMALLEQFLTDEKLATGSNFWAGSSIEIVRVDLTQPWDPVITHITENDPEYVLLSRLEGLAGRFRTGSRLTQANFQLTQLVADAMETHGRGVPLHCRSGGNVITVTSSDDPAEELITLRFDWGEGSIELRRRGEGLWMHDTGRPPQGSELDMVIAHSGNLVPQEMATR